MAVRFILLSWLAALGQASTGLADSESAASEIEQALHLRPDPQNGKQSYLLCAVCHMPEGWGEESGSYPQIAGQHYGVIIKQLADIRARNRDTPIMLPFTMMEYLSLQEIADVSAYISRLPMNPANGLGKGDDLEHGRRIYQKYCTDCHGERGQGIAEDFMPRIQGQHYKYLVRQFEWIRDGKRRNGDQEMIEQIKGFSSRDIAAVMDYVSRMQPPPETMSQKYWRNPDFPEFQRPDDSLP